MQALKIFGIMRAHEMDTGGIYSLVRGASSITVEGLIKERFWRSPVSKIRTSGIASGCTWETNIHET
jgi:hypothetical protein